MIQARRLCDTVFSSCESKCVLKTRRKQNKNKSHFALGAKIFEHTKNCLSFNSLTFQNVWFCFVSVFELQTAWLHLD